jgi:CheY-like chemotaxis protein
MPKTALIVEDEIFVALDLERILSDAGYDVTAIAADAPSALEAAQSIPSGGFAFVDVNLRDGPTGPDIARRLSQDYGLKVVFVTANPAQIGTVPEALGYIRKPFTERAILAAAAVCTDGTCDAANDDLIRLDEPAKSNAG